VEVPRDAEGRPRFSVSQFRTFGSGDLTLNGHEEEKGCPRQYHRKYVLKDVPGEERSRPLELGSVLHRALELMEENSIGPEDALMQAWSPRLDAAAWSEALRVLLEYLDRGGPMTVYATLAHELDVSSLLYEDEVYGPVMFRSILDYVGVDVNEPGVLHGVDFKSNQAPPTIEAVQRDMQMRSYDWQLRQQWANLVPGKYSPRIVMHLDALRYRDIAVTYTPDQAEEWRSWAEAVARQILRDETAEPHLNAGCTWCPVKHDCPKWLLLPDVGRSLAVKRTGQTPAQLHKQRKDLGLVKKLVEDALGSIDEQLEAEFRANGNHLALNGETWVQEDNWKNAVNLPRLHGILGDALYDVVTSSKSALEKYARTLPPEKRSLVLSCITREPVGTRIKKTTGGAG
jgi:hypothetical protein